MELESDISALNLPLPKRYVLLTYWSWK